MEQKKRYQFPLSDPQLPLALESIGLNGNQETIIREKGYPVYHWLQTIEGAGFFEIADQRIQIQKNQGLLLSPHIPHAYKASKPDWKTAYITFAGALSEELLRHFAIATAAPLKWAPDAPLQSFITDYLGVLSHHHDPAGLQSSTMLYSFMTLLKQYSSVEKGKAAVTQIASLKPLLKWLEEVYHDPSIGQDEMAERMQCSGKYLNKKFKYATGMTSYQYLLELRIKKAKERLSEADGLRIAELGRQVGFRDTSHFVATFRRYVSITPNEFRRCLTSPK